MRLLILFLVPFLFSCDRNSTSPGVYKTPPGGNGSQASGKVVIPKPGEINFTVFSFDDLGNNVNIPDPDNPKDKDDEDAGKVRYLKATVQKKIFEQSETNIAIFNNVHGNRGASHLLQILNGVQLKCVSTGESNDSNIVVCFSNKYFEIAAPEDDEFKINLGSATKYGFHGVIRKKSNKFAFNLVALNLMERDFDGNKGDGLRTVQIKNLRKYMASSVPARLFKTYPTLIIGDWQSAEMHTNNQDSDPKICLKTPTPTDEDYEDIILRQMKACEVDRHRVALKGSFEGQEGIDLKRSSPSEVTEMGYTEIFNHSLYTEKTWTPLEQPYNLGACPNNDIKTDKEKENYIRNQSIFCPTVFAFKYALTMIETD